MLRQVSLEVDVDNRLQRVASENGAQLTVNDCRDFNSKGVAMLIEIEGKNGGDVERSMSALRKAAWVKHVYEAEMSESRVLCVAVLDRPLLCDVSLNTGVICLGCPYNSTAQSPNWDILVRNSDMLRSLIARLEKEGVGAKVKDVSQVSRDDSLTGRQKEILAKAISLGYFEFPRRIDLTSLSKLVGVRPSTLSEILRSAEKKVMEGVGKELGVACRTAQQVGPWITQSGQR